MSEFQYPKAILLNSNLKDTSDRQVDYRALFYTYVLSKWYVYLIFGMMGIGLAYYFYKKQQPVYGIIAKLLIRERDQDYGPTEDYFKRNISFSGTSEKASNEIEILTSLSLMTSVVKELGLERNYFREHKLSKYEAYRKFPIVVDTFVLNPIKNTTFKIIPLNDRSFQFAQGSHVEVHKFGELFSNHFGKFRIRKTKYFTLPSASDTTLQVAFLDPKVIARNYLGSLKVGLSDEKNKSSVLVLSLQDAEPERGIDVLSVLVEKFDLLKSRANTETTLKTLDLLDGRLADISADLVAAESTVESYKLNNDIISEATTDLNITMEDVSYLVTEQRNLELQLKMLQVMRSDLRDTTSNQFNLIPMNPSLYDGRVQELIQPYNDLVVVRERLLLKGQFSNPVIQANDQKLRSLRSSINTGVEHMQNDLGARLSKVKDQHNKSFGRLRSVPQKERGLSDRMRIQSIKENLYVYLLQKREETALAMVRNYTNAMLIDPPYSTISPIAPSKAKIFLAAAFGSQAFSFFLVLFFNLFVGLIKTEKDVKQILTQKAILGVINHQKGKNQKSLLGQPQNLMTERFRSLRTNLQFYNREKTKCILVTSSTVNEGKTFVASNLAMSFALAKKKTIVIDFDLRKPSIAKYFKGNEEIGLSNFFTEELGITEIIQVSAELPNLHFILAGPITPNLVEFITEQHLAALFLHVKGEYDIIIIDSSPIGIISDGIMLNDFVDNTLFVVRSGFTKKSMLEKAREIFEQNKMVNPSIIFNGVKKQNDSYDYGYNYKQYSYSSK